MRRLPFAFFLTVAFAVPLWAAAENEGYIAGERLFNSRCGLCHQLPDPKSLSRAQWQVALKTMNKRLERNGMEPLTDVENQALRAYFEAVGAGN
ncbi:MAG: hypothetical protein HY751_14030 [Nitrospinae bacterium]|nr:hypothetical protein [Nitrospinota bacterium]